LKPLRGIYSGASATAAATLKGPTLRPQSIASGPAAKVACSRPLAAERSPQLGHSTTATAIRMARVANDIPASAPRPLGGCQVFIPVMSPHRTAFEVSHAIDPDAITKETVACDLVVRGPE